ncbi:MAG: hypothetical protein WD851_20950 [Pirellulales bacterium]
MAYTLRWTETADATYTALRSDAEKQQAAGKTSSRQIGTFKQIAKAIRLLRDNPRHPSLHTHEYSGIENPFDPDARLWEAYAQNKTPSAYRVFWSYGPGRDELTTIAITSHP